MDKAIKKRIEQIARGEAPEGYEKTAFGIFPCDWEKVSIGDTAAGKGEYGLNAPACEYESDLPKYLRITDINDDFRYIDSGARIRSKYCNEYRLKDGDIVFARTGASVGKNYLYNSGDGELIYAGFLIKFSIKKQYDPYLVALNCRTKKYSDWVTKISARSGQPGINAEEYATYEFVVPKSTEEQRKIADILMLWDKAIELKEKLIAEKDKQKQYLMDVLLTGKVRLPGFSDDWERVELKKVSTMCSGGTPSTENEEYYGGEYIWVSIADMTATAKYLTDSNKKLSELGLNNCSARLFPAGTVLFAMYASIGECVIAGKECATSQAILGITPDNEKLNNEFLYYALKQQQNKIVKMQQASSQPNLNKSLVESIIINVPSLKMLQKGIKEQEEIVKVLSMADAEIDALKEELILQRKQRDALMRLLLTGIVRVKYE